MNKPTSLIKIDTPRLLLLVAVPFIAVAYSALAHSAPADGSPYYTDPQSSYVQDATSKSIGQVNMINCFIGAMRPDAMVNLGAYKALVDENKCDSDKRSNTSNATASAGASAPDYTQATLVSTRASNNDPMKVKAWVHSTIGQNDDPGVIYVGINAVEAVSDTRPYGVFRLDICGRVLDATSVQCVMKGVLDAKVDGLSFYQEEGGGGGHTALKLTRDSGADTGAGRVLSIEGGNGQSTSFTFAYSGNAFLRDDGASPVCFSRSKDLAQKSVWRYGLYDANGARVDRNGGFPITYTDPATSKVYQGNVGYFGVWMQDDKASSLASGTVVKRQSYSQGAVDESYSLYKAAGRLTKYSRKTTTLDKLTSVRINASLNLNNQFTNFEMYWNGTQFVKSGVTECGQNGCRITTLSPVQPIANSVWAANGGIFGNSNALGGEVSIPVVSGLANPATVQVVYREQSLVYPTDMPTDLYCLGECADNASLQSFFTDTQNAVQSPFIVGTSNSQFQPMGVPLTSLVHYNASTSTGLVTKMGDSSPLLLSNSSWVQNKPQYQGGFRNGKMFTDPTAALCDGSQTQVCGSKVYDLATYYVWESGTQSFNQFVALTTTDNSNCGAAPDKFCRFDAPLQVSYNVATDPDSGGYDGQQFVLSYNGFGDLFGIPGTCVNELTNATVDCGTGGGDGVRYVPAFVIPFDTTKGVVTATTSTGASTMYYVRWLERELRFAQVSMSSCAGLTLPTGLVLPDGTDYLNPGDPASASYIGVEPALAGAPRVVQGEVKY